MCGDSKASAKPTSYSFGYRKVYARHGTNAAMGYKYRARIEKRNHQYKYVLERYFMAWKDDYTSKWYTDEPAAVTAANEHLDAKGSIPDGKYI